MGGCGMHKIMVKPCTDGYQTIKFMNFKSSPSKVSHYMKIDLLVVNVLLLHWKSTGWTYYIVVKVYLQGELCESKHDYYALKFEISGHAQLQ